MDEKIFFNCRHDLFRSRQLLNNQKTHQKRRHAQTEVTQGLIKILGLPTPICTPLIPDN